MVNSNISMKNARIIFRNFAGKEKTFNPEGKRNFCVCIDKELAETLLSDGWNVRYLQPKDEDEEPQAYLQVAFSFDKLPPRIIMITSSGKTVLDEESVKALDYAEIKNVDLILRPYNWVRQEGTRNEKRGVKAYLKSLYITIVEDEFESKYRDVPMERVAEDIDGD